MVRSKFTMASDAITLVLFIAAASACQHPGQPRHPQSKAETPIWIHCDLNSPNHRVQEQHKSVLLLRPIPKVTMFLKRTVRAEWMHDKCMQALSCDSCLMCLSCTNWVSWKIIQSDYLSQWDASIMALQKGKYAWRRLSADFCICLVMIFLHNLQQRRDVRLDTVQ